jgi:hypothetical protein
MGEPGQWTVRLFLDRLLLIAVIVGLVSFVVWFITHAEVTRGSSV